LSSFGIELDRPSLERLCDQALSAEEIAQPLLDQRTFHGRQQQMESDWIWICLSALWQRWFPDKPSFEALDDKMQAGYELRASGAVAACHVWLEAWNDVLRILDKAGMHSIQEFDERFQGSQSLFNWMQDLEGELWNAGLEDRQFLTARIALCEEGLRRFRTDDDLMTEVVVQLLCYHACSEIRPPAGGIGDDDGDRARWIGLGVRKSGCAATSQQRRGKEQPPIAYHHQAPPPWSRTVQWQNTIRQAAALSTGCAVVV